MTARKDNALREQGADNAKHFSANHTRHNDLRQCAQRLVGTLAVWGVLPIRLADWLMRVLRLGAI